LAAREIGQDNSSSVRPDSTDAGSFRTGLRRVSSFLRFISSHVSSSPSRIRVSA
jgi:hypothetical protein